MKLKRIVTIGGGTGSFTLLSGLKHYPVDLSAIVSMADDGGSTGVLRDELGVLPPGDVRQCLTALSESSSEMRELLNYRFDEGSLEGHSFGNLFLSALEKINGSFSRGLEKAMHILNVRGEVLPVTDQDSKLKLVLSDGSILSGESEINHSHKLQDLGIKSFGFQKKVAAYPKTLKRIREATTIVIGPGNFYCSLLPNLILPEVAQAIAKARAKVIFVCNLTNKKGHTIGWEVDDYVAALERYIGQGRVDYVIFNAKKPSAKLVAHYEKQEGKDTLVKFDPKRNAKRSYQVVKADIVSALVPKIEAADAIASTRSFIRHNPKKLAQVIVLLSELADSKNSIQSIV
jgi:uncharacterized cofD-like protein